MGIIHRADAYGLKIKLSTASGVLTTASVDALDIKINGVKKSYPGTVTFDSSDTKWIYPLTEAETRAMPKTVEWQAKATQGSDVWQTDVMTIEIGETLF